MKKVNTIANTVVDREAIVEKINAEEKAKAAEKAMRVNAAANVKGNAFKAIANGIELPEIVGDRNFWKDIFDVTTPTGMNVLMIPHAEDEDKNVYSSAQMWMKLFRNANDAIKNGADTEQVLSDLDEVIKTAIDHTINEVSDLDGCCRDGYRGFEEVDASYTSSLLMGLNSGALNMWPQLIKGATNDIARTLSNHVQLDRYHLDGHTSMISIDPVYELLKKKFGVKEALTVGVTSINGNIMNVIDPRATRFFNGINATREERYGALMKYPSVGTRETVLVHFMDDEEIEAALMDLVERGYLTEEEAICAAEQYANIKEGIIEMPSDLAAIGSVLAGSDRDGDKTSVILHRAGQKDIPWFLMEYGFKPLAVDIVPTKPEEKGERYEIDGGMYSTNFHMINQNHNEKVGPVTNAGRVEIQPLCVIDWVDITKQLFIDCFKEVWKAGTEAEEGDGKYHTPLTWSKDEYGREICRTNPKAYVNGQWVDPYEEDGETLKEEYKDEKIYDAYHAFEKAVHMTVFEGTVEEQWNTLLEILKDFDVLIRHTQECTIDAEKKFYKVYTDFVAKLKAVMTVTPLKFGARFVIDWAAFHKDPEADVKAELKEDDLLRKDEKVILLDMNGNEISREGFRGVMAEEPVKLFWPAEKKGQDDRQIVVFNDFFAGYRRYAIEKSMEKLNELIARYKTAINSEEYRARREKAYDDAVMHIASQRTENRMQVAIEMGKAINEIYREERKAMMDANSDEYGDIDNSKSDAIRKALHEKYDDVFGSISNTIRWMVTRDNSKVTPEDLVGYLAGGEDITTSAGSNMSKLLKEETAYAAIKLSENSEAVEFVHARYNNMEALESLVEGQDIIVKDGEVYSGRMRKIEDLYVSGNVMDGMYRISMRDDSPAIVRDLTDFVTIPEVDRSQVAFKLDLKAIWYPNPEWNGVDQEDRWLENKEQVAINRAIVDSLSSKVGCRISLAKVKDGNFERLGMLENGKPIAGLYVDGSKDGHHYNEKAAANKSKNAKEYARKNHAIYSYEAAVRSFYEGFSGIVSVVYADSKCNSAIVVLTDVESRNAGYDALPEDSVKESSALTLDDVETIDIDIDIDL